MRECSCPICGTPILATIYRKSLLGKVTVPPDKDMTVVAYRCQNGHICPAREQPTEQDWRKREAA